MRQPLRKIALAALIAANFAALGYGQTGLPMPKHYVEDYAGVINDSDEHSLNGILQELEQKTGAQYIVLTVLTTGGLPIEQFAIELAEKWKLGRKGKDDGLLFVLAKNDRAWRFEVGYGLEGFVTDQHCGRVGRNVLVPYLRKEQYSQGIYQANLQVAQAIATEHGVTLSGMPTLEPVPVGNNSHWWAPCSSALPLLIMILLILGGLGREMGWWWFFLPFMMGGFGGHGGYGRSGSFGGGSFGGSFGGFGGGLGGRFGGGGASGRW